MDNDLESRVRRIEEALNELVDYLATIEQHPDAWAPNVEEDGNQDAARQHSLRALSSDTIVDHLRLIERLVLRLQLELGRLSKPGPPWNAEEMERLYARIDAKKAVAAPQDPEYESGSRSDEDQLAELAQALHQRLDEYTDTDVLTPDAVRTIIDDTLSGLALQQFAQQREAFYALARARYEEYLVSGMAILWEDMTQYLQDRAAGKRTAPPKPRNPDT